MYRIHVMISGKVQDVFFRISTQDKANELNLTGWVKNIFNNAVEIIAEGESDIILGNEDARKFYLGDTFKY